MKEPILIAGAGIGGLSAALALARRGIPSRIVERASEIREIGAGLQLGPNGFRAFERLGVAGAMDAISFKPDAVRLIDSVENVELSRQTLGAPFEARFHHPYRVGYRADVQLVLLEAVQACWDLVTIELGDGVSRIAERDDHVEIVFDSGRSLSAPLLIGADGIWSQVRSHLLGPEPPRPSGHIAYRAVLPIAEVPDALLTDDVQVWIGPGHHLVCYKLRGGALFNIIAIVHSDREVQGWDTLGDKAELQRGFADACPLVRQLVGQIEHGRMWALCDRDPMQGWSKGRITLLGDAAHPMLPYLAQGACMAIEDAVTLADEIAATPGDPVQALARYEEARFARTASVQKAARETGVINHATGEARERRNAFLASRRADDYDSVAWLFGGTGARAESASGAEIGIFGRHAAPAGTAANAASN
jgi:salicylate hydroxylase